VQTIVGGGAGSVQPDGYQLRLGWLGLGRTGSALVRRLLAAGSDVEVYNRIRSEAEPFAAGDKLAGSPANLVARDIVFVMAGLPHDLTDAVPGPVG
jgi:3-hydroxyisobutyrate dehydrogenase